MATAGRKKVVETPEFADAVAKAVAAQMEGFKKDLLTAASNPAPAAGGGMTDLLTEVLSKLSLNMQSLNQQGQYNKPVLPEEVLRREQAHNRMVDLIMASRQDGSEKPSYRVTSKIYLNERLIDPFKVVDKKAVHNEITWTGVPNDGMAPINDTAHAIYNAWRESTGGPTQLVPTADKRPLHVTAAGLTVRGEPPKRRHVAAEAEFSDDLGFANNDPNAPEVSVLGTVAPKARQNSVGGVETKMAGA